MHLKGIEKLREKLPDYPNKRIGLLPLRGILAAVLGYGLLIILDIIPRVLSGNEFLLMTEPYLPIIGSVITAGFGFWLIGRLWSQRDSTIEKYGNLAYQKMIRKGVVGVFLIPSILFHAATSIRSLPPVPPVNDLTILWSQSILPFIGIPSDIDILLRLGASLFFLLMGLLTVRSALRIFGIDYMTVVYLYFPKESEMQENEIYSVVRHPTYLGGALICVAAAVFRFSVYSILIGFIGYMIFKLQTIREDNELLERFGNSYREYMDKANAFLIKPRDMSAYFRFLRGHTNE